MAKVAGMASRLVRSTAIAAGVAAVAGLGIGYAVGEPSEPTQIIQARKLDGAALCPKLGDVSSLLPAANGYEWQHTGKADVVCLVLITEPAPKTFSAGSLKVRITPSAGRAAGAGQPPFTPAEVAKQTFDRNPRKLLPDQPYPTRIETSSKTGGESWQVSVIAVRADLLVQVDYTAHPITEEAAKRAALVMADRAIWEAK